MNFYADPCIALTGGADGALDAIDGATVSDGCFAVTVTGSAAYMHQLDEDSAAAESSPYVISPDSNAGDKRWILRRCYSGKDELVDVGDPLDWHFTVGDLTTDGSYHDLDLSAVVPSGAKFVVLNVQARDDAVGMYVAFRKKGNSNTKNISQLYIQVANAFAQQQMIVPCSTARVIQYNASNTVFTDININVAGYIL